MSAAARRPPPPSSSGRGPPGGGAAAASGPSYADAEKAFKGQKSVTHANLEAAALKVKAALSGVKNTANVKLDFGVLGGVGRYLLCDDANRATTDVDVLVSKPNMATIRDSLKTQGFIAQGGGISGTLRMYGKFGTEWVKVEILKTPDFALIDLVATDLVTKKNIPVLNPTKYVMSKIDSFAKRSEQRDIEDIVAVLTKHQATIEWAQFKTVSTQVKAVLAKGNIPLAVWPQVHRPT